MAWPPPLTTIETAAIKQIPISIYTYKQLISITKQNETIDDTIKRLIKISGY